MQTQTSSTPASDDTSDAVLLLRTREGDAHAYGALYLRHVGAAKVLARQLARDASEADELVAESFTRVLAVLQRGAGPEAALRPYLLSTMRRLHIDRRVAERKVEPTDDLSSHDPGEPFVDLPADELERSIVSTAYASLPERWRLVLWHTEVEGLQPAQVAPLLGVSPNAAAALAVRARAGLRDAYLSAHVSDAVDPGCRPVAPSLGGYVRGTLSRRERGTVEQHLDGCARCSAAVLELGDTAATMRAVIGPLILGAVVLGYRDGILALGAHAVPSAALLHGAAGATHLATGASGATGASSASGATGASGAGGTGATGAAAGGHAGVLSALGAPGWAVLTGAGVLVAAVVATAVGLNLSGGQPKRAGAPPTATSPAAPSAASQAPGDDPTGDNPTAPPTSPATDPGTGGSSTATSTTTVALTKPGGLSLSSVGDLVAGQGGTIRITTSNPARTAVRQTMQVHLPAGVSASSYSAAVVHGNADNASYTALDSAGSAGSTGSPEVGQCLPTDYGAECNLGSVAARSSATVTLPVTVGADATATRWRVRVTSTADGQSATTAITGKMTVRLVGVRALWAGTGPYLVAAAGNGLMSCQNDTHPVPGCTQAQQRQVTGNRSNNEAWAMYPVNDAGSGWANSSRATLSLPSGDVAAAFLTWSASGFGDVARLPSSADVKAPGLAKRTVRADTFTPASLGSSGNGYVATADVTSLVRDAAKGSGTWAVGDIALAGGPAQKAVYGGWALTVVTRSATAPIRDVTVLGGPWNVAKGHDWSGSAPGLGQNPAQLTMVAWEGDAGLTGDRVAVHGSYLKPQDGRSGSDNVAASYALGASRALTFGTDVRQLRAPTGSGDTVRVTSEGDNWILGLLVVSAGGAAGL